MKTAAGRELLSSRLLSLQAMDEQQQQKDQQQRRQVQQLFKMMKFGATANTVCSSCSSESCWLPHSCVATKRKPAAALAAGGARALWCNEFVPLVAIHSCPFSGLHMGEGALLECLCGCFIFLWEADQGAGRRRYLLLLFCLFCFVSLLYCGFIDVPFMKFFLNICFLPSGAGILTKDNGAEETPKRICCL